MNILLAGASGFIGHPIAQALKQDGHHIITCCRQSGIDFKQHLHPKDWLPHLQGVDVVINAVGIIVENRQQCFDILHRQAPIALFKACEQSGVSQVIQISALGINEQSFTAYQLSKKAADDHLLKSTLHGFILRPSLVYGAGGASMKLFRQLAKLPLIPLAGDGEYQVQPVHINDVVATVQKCLSMPPHASQHSISVLNVVGAKALSFRQWLQAIRMADSRKPAIMLPVPFKLIMALAHTGRHIMPLLHPDNLRMLRAGNTADVSPLCEFLGRLPLTPEQGLRL